MNHKAKLQDDAFINATVSVLYSSGTLQRLTTSPDMVICSFNFILFLGSPAKRYILRHNSKTITEGLFTVETIDEGLVSKLLTDHGTYEVLKILTVKEEG